jgi:protein pelota
MKIISSDFKNGKVKMQVESLDDLWYLSTLIDIGDCIKGSTLRKIKKGDSERKTEATRKYVNLTVKAELVDFSNDAESLRVKGTIIDGPEDVARGSYHTFSLEEKTIFTLIKLKWLKFQKDRLQEASQTQLPKILLCIHDREEAFFALLKKFGYTVLSTIKGRVNKKADVKTEQAKNFYDEIMTALHEYDKQHKLNTIVLASPAFWKEDMMKAMKVKQDPLIPKIVLATCSSCDETSFNELLKRPEVQRALHQDRISKELSVVDELLKEISQDNLGTYGFNEVKAAAEAGAVKKILVTTSYIKKTREGGIYGKVEEVMNLVESSKGTINIISDEHEGGRKLNGLGGIAGLLRYKIA